MTFSNFPEKHPQRRLIFTLGISLHYWYNIAMNRVKPSKSSGNMSICCSLVKVECLYFSRSRRAHTHIYVCIYIYMHTYSCMILHNCFRRIGGLIGLESHFRCWKFPTFRTTEANPIHGVPRHLRHSYSEAGRTGRCAVCSRSPLVEGQQNLTTWRIQKYA